MALSVGVISRQMFLRVGDMSVGDLSQELISPLLESIEQSAWNPLVGSHSNAVTIGYFISVTGCSSDSLAEGAAVLKHSIHMTSLHGDLGGRYDYKMHAIVHPSAAGCVAPLVELGYDVVERDTPVQVDEIKGDFLRSRIENNGCCGIKELIKLEAYTFTEYPVVVHLDLDFLLLKPLDDLFDAMLLDEERAASAFDRIKRMWPEKPKPPKINAFFTRDCFVVNWNIMYKAVQGGFLVLRPDRSAYNQYVDIFREGDFREGLGWGGKKVGPFYGAMTVQGLLPYYYDILHPEETVDLNPCVYNLMAGNPMDEPMENGEYRGKCRSGQEVCEDCRLAEIENMASVHFTNCQKPWLCLPYKHATIEHKICRKIVHQWYKVRSKMEQSWGRSGMGPGQWEQRDHFLGYCQGKEKEGYIPVAKPYGRNATYP